jgi:hypothetical protein
MKLFSAFRDSLHLVETDLVQWTIDKNGIHLEPIHKPFLKHKGTLDIKSKDIKADIRKAWEIQTKRKIK